MALIQDPARARWTWEQVRPDAGLSDAVGVGARRGSVGRGKLSPLTRIARGLSLWIQADRGLHTNSNV